MADDNVKDLTVQILRKIHDQLKAQGAELKALRTENGSELKAIRAELVHMRQDSLKRATTTEVSDLRKQMRNLEERVGKVERRVG